ncbi:MAG: hypothetical protein IJ680_03505 [Paludibacteraceae bacterium]|nr:Reverse transcriptase (RNA-dependent DNA polymerase) [Eubacterium sp.]MBR1630899.1 hypothetical protein [Paludibacteraceae bacterium]
MTSKERHEARYQRRRAQREAKKRERYGDCDDFDKVFTYANLFDAYKKSKRGVNWKASTQKFTANAALNVFRLYDTLHNSVYRSPGFCEFDIYERGKARHIRSVIIDERVVQRCLCDNSLVPLMTRTFVYDNGACMRGKGYDFAINRLRCHVQRHFRKYGTDGYVLLFDFSKFFDTLPHDIVNGKVDKEIKDPRIRDLTHHFVEAFGEYGLGLGSQISQVLALASANSLDHFIKEELKIKGYGRYMDDGYLIHQDRKYLEHCLDLIKKKCDELGLTINLKKTRITKLTSGFTFLKVRHYLTESGRIIRKIPRDGITRMRRKLKKLKRRVDAGLMELDDVRAALQSWAGHTLKYDAYRTRCAMYAHFVKLYFNDAGGGDNVLQNTA